MRKLVVVLSLFITACGGGGGSPKDQSAIVNKAPIPVLSSSYENEMMAANALGQQNLPYDWKPCGTRTDCGSFVAPAMVFADFMRDGSYSMITHTIEYNAVNVEDMDRKGHIKFYQMVDGVWTDNTYKILPSNQTQGCLHASKALVADFMQNGRPSVFFSCYGFDAPTGTGEKQRILLAQNDGSYKNVELTNVPTCYCHSASAADVNGDGYPDIAVVDNYLKYTAYFLINNKDGTFTPDYNRLPSELLSSAWFQLELIDFNNDGKYDIQMGGVENCCIMLRSPAVVYYNVNNKYFANRIVIPSVAGYGMVLDVVFDNGYLYLSRTMDDPEHFYSKFIIQRVKLSTMESTVLFESASNISIPQNIISQGTSIVSLASNYKLTVSK